jgi:hypothetical protein
MAEKEAEDDGIDLLLAVIVIDLHLQDEEEEVALVGNRDLMISNLVDDLDQETFRLLVVDIVVMMIMTDDILDPEAPLLDFRDLHVVDHRSLLRLHYWLKMILIGIFLFRAHD